MNKNFFKLDDIIAYQIASDLGDYVWKIASKWDIFAKKTIGSQFVDSMDSVAANIAEGFGRFHKKDKQKFYYNARGSAYESAHWCRKCYQRALLTKEENEYIIEGLRKLPKEINTLIKLTGNLKI